MKHQTMVTQEGLEKLKAELKELKHVKRPEVIERLKAARTLGDLSENSEYDDARNEQSFIEGRIEELEEMIKNAKIVQGKTGDGTVSLGSKIICEIEDDKEEYELVSSIEADPSAGKISIDSPLGRALQGHKKGDTVTVNAPAGELMYKIIDIQ